MNLILRILIAIVLMAGCAANTAAQSKVRDITVRPDVFDLTASTSQRLDMNGNPCGLLKVSVPADNVEFQGNIIGDVVRHGGAYWVYVTNGTKKIRMTSAAFGDVDLLFADWNIPHIQSKTTYTVSVEMTAPGDNAAPAKRGYVQFTLTPANAFIVFNGQQLDVTGGTAYKLVPYGSYSYTAQAAGYEPYTGTVNVNSGQVQVPVKLRSNKAHINVTAATPGSKIYVDGVLKGETQWNGELMPGDYIVEARRDGYRPRDISVTLTAASERNVVIPALEMITGELSIEYRPLGAHISLDGKAVGTTPTLLADIPAGTHTLSIAHPGYVTATLNVTVTDSGTTPVTGTLKKTAAPGPAAQSGSTSQTGETLPHFSTSPVNMALCAKGPDGYVYITADQWKKLSESQKSAFKPLGIYLAAGNFIVELYDKENGKRMNWNAAMKYNLPTKEQGQILVDNKAALNDALKAFGGTEIYAMHWTKTEDKYNPTRKKFILNGDLVYSIHKFDLYWVRAVAAVPDTLKKTAAHGAAEQHGTNVPAEKPLARFSTSPINMALCAKGPDGYVYITADQWKKLSESQKSTFTPQGVYVAAGNFLVELHDKENGKEMNWNAAMKYNLPTKEQGGLLADNEIALFNALRAFGGTEMDWWYWTKTKYKSSHAWVFHIGSPGSYRTKTIPYKVRAIAPVPESSAR